MDTNTNAGATVTKARAGGLLAMLESGMGNLVGFADRLVRSGQMAALRRKGTSRNRALTVRERQKIRAKSRVRDEIARRSRRYNLRMGA